eukprot:gene9976-13418_t
MNVGESQTVIERSDKIPLLYWHDILTIIETNRLELLGRSEDQQKTYNSFREQLLTQWKSIKDYLLVKKFTYDVEIGDDGLKIALIPNDREIFSLQLHINDYPYHFEHGVIHYILWKLNSEIVQIEIEQAAEELMKKHNTTDWCYYLNPPHLKSIPEIEHLHILIYSKHV